MPLSKRIISRLDIKGSNLVKGVNLEGLRVLGKPEQFAEYYYLNGADELYYQDVVASLYGKNSLKEIISKTAKNIFIPLTVGGGIRTLEDISSILKSGADKVAINTAAIQNPLLIKKAAKIFGSSTISISIEASKVNNKYLAFTDNGRNNSNILVLDWIKKVQDLGAGEIIITDIQLEGTGKGFNKELFEMIVSIVDIPIIYNGGIGNIYQAKNLFNSYKKLSGLSLSSMFHYYCLNNNIFEKIEFDIGNIDYLHKNNKFTKFETYKISTFKKKLFNK